MRKRRYSDQIPSSQQHRRAQKSTYRHASLLLLLTCYIVWRAFYIDTSFPQPLHPHYDAPLTSSPRVVILQTIFAPRSTLLSLFMGIFGRAWPERDLYQASVRGYERYARTWGYGYQLETQRWVESGKGVKIPYLNKVHAVLALARAEVAKGPSGAEWIMTADTDTLILDPSIPLTYFLPLPDQHPPPTLLANQDHNGFNSGVLFWRVTPRLISFLESTLSYEPVIFAETGRHPFDQHLYCYALQRKEEDDFARGVYEIPQRWFNGYSRPVVSADNPHGGPGGPSDIAVTMHLVNWVKWRERWKTTIERPVRWMYQEAEAVAVAQGTTVRDVYLRSDSAHTAQLVAKDWWRSEAVAGIDGIRFNEY